MKSIGPAFGAVRKAVEGGMMADAKTSAETLSKAFVETEGFFKSHGKADGVELAQAAKKAADGIAAAKDADGAKAAAGELGKTCAGCHSKYREKAADGSYTYKPGN
jgi:cytochrome c556